MSCEPQLTIKLDAATAKLRAALLVAGSDEEKIAAAWAAYFDDLTAIQAWYLGCIQGSGTGGGEGN